jgi:ABC-type branched-subunit amino acid transport system ATPase component
VLEGGRVVIEGPASDIANERRVVDAYLGSDKGKAA